jgi:hypothetical protein
VLVAQVPVSSEHHTRHRQCFAHHPQDCAPNNPYASRYWRNFPLHPLYSAGRTFAGVLVFLFALEDEVLGSFVKRSVVRLALLQSIISDVALSLHLLHLLLAQLLDVEDLVIAEPEDGLLDPGAVDTVRSVGLPGVTLADVRAVGSSEVSDAVAEGVLVSGCGVLWGDETVFNLEALLPEGEDGVFEVREHPDFFDDVTCVGVVLDVDDHGVGAPGLELWLGGLAMVVHRWWS